MLFMGLDVGTQGARCVVADEAGAVRAAHSIAFDTLNTSAVPGLYEQSPDDWRRAVEGAIAGAVGELRRAGLAPCDIRSISIDGTSGTIVPLDKENRPLMPALMYNDPRAKAEAAAVHEAMADHEARLGMTFGASFSLPRILWIKAHLPDVYDKAAVFSHQADYVAGLLCGEYRVSDYSNALKTGYDLLGDRWPEAAFRSLGLDLQKMPRIVRPGAPIANVSKDAAARLGLSTESLVVGGSTDGYASALAAGAVTAGNWASIIGTTFVLKGVTKSLVIDPSGSSYSHMLPSGEWMLGGASNIGGRCLNGCLEGRTFDEMNALAAALVPTGAYCYPLMGVGERFPFVDPDALAFYRGDILNGKLYPALMEGVAFAEKMALDRMAALGAQVGDTIWTTGGACRSELWLKIRASVLGRRLIVPKVVDAAMGSALLAASDAFGSLKEAASAMIRYEKTVDPAANWVPRYADTYEKFALDAKKLYRLEA